MDGTAPYRSGLPYGALPRHTTPAGRAGGRIFVQLRVVCQLYPFVDQEALLKNYSCPNHLQCRKWLEKTWETWRRPTLALFSCLGLQYFLISHLCWASQDLLHCLRHSLHIFCPATFPQALTCFSPSSIPTSPQWVPFPSRPSSAGRRHKWMGNRSRSCGTQPDGKETQEIQRVG